MSKAQALGWAFVCGLAALCCHLIGFVYLDLTALIGALGFTVLWFAKYLRDKRIVTQSQMEQEAEPKALPPVMTSPGSARLFVPPPLREWSTRQRKER